MEVVLETIAGPNIGRKLSIEYGQVMSFGRTEKSDVALGDDFMSGVHFAVEYGPNGCRVIDRGSRNGTFLNDAQVTESFVVAGDKIRAGQSTFVVHFSRAGAAAPAPMVASPAAAAFTPPAPPPMPAPPAPSFAAAVPPAPYAPPAAVPPPPPPPPIPAAMPPAAAARPPMPSFQRRPAVLTIGSWSFGRIPDGWEPQEGFGIQQKNANGFPSNVVCTEEQIFEGTTLQQFVEAQVTMLRQYLREPRIEAALPPGIPGAEESVAIDVRYNTKEGETVMYKRIYARTGPAVGVLTLTTLEKDLENIRAAFRELIEETGFYPAKA